jgi:adenylyltransferase/sulfurtransferase
MRIRGWGEGGQEKLKASRVVVAGIGGLGCPAAVYLAAAGVGLIRIIDREKVELSNLNRQILHWEEDVGSYKVDSAVEKLRRLNRDVQFDPVKEEITEENVRRLIRGFNLVVDGMDNYKTRFLLNEACVKERVPFIHGCVYGFEGRITTIIPFKTPCLTCIYKAVPPEEGAFPVLGATPAFIAALQVVESIKLLTGIGKPLANRMLIISGVDMSVEEITLERNINCPVCGEQ